MKTVYTSKSDILTAYQLMSQTEKDKFVKIISYDIPYRTDVCLYDLSLNAHGQDEDKVYASDKWYRANIRRGNSVIQIFDKNNNVISTFYGRRGFEKFFDLTYEYIQYNLQEIKSFNNFGIKNTDEHYELHDVIFGKVQHAIQQKKKILAYKLVKANGENAQVSWIDSLKAWIIASKNVSLLARDEQDLKDYHGERFHFSLLLAKEWFRIISPIQKQGLQNELKIAMTGKTFIGEYCGNQDYQHLVKYREIDIHFTAIVDNQSQSPCLPPEEAYQRFNKFGLTSVAYQNLGTFENWQSLNHILKKAFVNVAESSIDSEEEGSVIYLVEVDEKGKQSTLSLSKLKTLEYRIYRKLREKLRNFLAQKGNNYRSWKEYQSKFKAEVAELCQGYNLPMPLEYYFMLAQKAGTFGDKYFNQSNIIHDQHITFIALLIYQTSHNEDLSPDCFREELIKKAMEVKWTDLYKLYQYRNNPTSQELLTNKKLYVFIPIGIPGMGKSYFLKTLQKIIEGKNGYFSVISSDGIRQECMEKLSKFKKNLSNEELFDQTGKDARNLFNERLEKLISSSTNNKGRPRFVFIDKNHPPNAIKSTIDFIRGYAEDYEIIALTPLIQEEIFSYEDDAKIYKYPFSLGFFLNCLERVQKRTEHETLPGSGVRSAAVLITFLNFFRNVNLNKASILKNGFDRVLPVPFTTESSQIPINSELIQTLVEVLKVTKPNEGCKDEKVVSVFLSTFEKSYLQFPFPDPKLIEDSITEFLQEEIFVKILENEDGGKTGYKIAEKRAEEKEEQKEIKKITNLPVYNPKKTPLYLGLFTKDYPRETIRCFILDGLDDLIKNFPKDKILVDAFHDISDHKPYDHFFVKDFHVTSLYIGGNPSKKETEFFKSFQPGLEIDIDLVGLIIVPFKIVTAICYPDQSVIKIENKFPHVTLMTGTWNPKHSNDVLENLFAGHGPLREQDETKKFLSEKKFVCKAFVKVAKQTTEAYVIKTPKLKLSVIADECF